MAVAERIAAGASVDVSVRAIAAGGAGVAELPDGRVCFVPRTAPGDRARVRIDKSKARWAVGSLVRVLEPGPVRCEAPCMLYARCGGCQLQHLPYEEQLLWKGRFVAEALTRIGHVGEVEPPEVVGSPRRLHYRNRLTFTLRRLRGGRVVAGFHGLGRPGHVIDVRTECLLPEPGLSSAWSALRAGWGPGARTLPGVGRLKLTLRHTADGTELVVEGGPDGWDATALGEAVPRLRAIHHRPEGRGQSTRLVFGSDGVGSAFAQVNTDAATLLRQCVVEWAGQGTTAVDAYSGVGALSRELAASGWSVVGIEADPAAVGLARRSATAGVSVLHGRVEERLVEALPADVVVLNPPRTGLHPEVPRVVTAAPPERLIYVSCDPSTLARDVSRLAPSFRLVRLRAFDLFPQTAHVETVAVLEHTESPA